MNTLILTYHFSLTIVVIYLLQLVLPFFEFIVRSWPLRNRYRICHYPNKVLLDQKKPALVCTVRSNSSRSPDVKVTSPCLGCLHPHITGPYPFVFPSFETVHKEPRQSCRYYVSRSRPYFWQDPTQSHQWLWSLMTWSLTLITGVVGDQRLEPTL